MSETGFVEGRNLAVEYRWNYDAGRQREQAADRVDHHVAVIATNAAGPPVLTGIPSRLLSIRLDDEFRQIPNGTAGMGLARKLDGQVRMQRCHDLCAFTDCSGNPLN